MIPLANDIVTVSEDTTIKVWSSSLGVPLFRQSTDDKATSISLSVDGGLLAVGFGSGVISVFKTQSTDRCVWSHHVDSAVASVRFFGQLIVVAYKSGGQIFRATNGERVAQLATGDPDLMCADAGGGSIVTGHASGALKVFEASMIVGLKHNKTTLQSWTEKFEHEDAVTCCALSPKALRLATVGRDKKLVIWEMNELLERKKDSCVQSVVRQCHNDWVLSCAWSDGGNSLVVTGGLDCAVKVWDADKQCALIATFTHHSAAILSLAFQKKVIASTDSDGTVCVVSAKGGALVTRIKPVTNGPMPVACALRIGNSTNDDASQLNPDDKIDWAAEMDAALESGRGDSSTVAADRQNSLLRDSQLAVAFDSGSFQVYNPFMGDEKTCATGHSAPVLCVASAANGTGDSFVTGDKNGLCKWWGEMSLESETTTRLSGAVTAMIVDTNCVIAGCRDGSLYVMDSNGSKMSSWKAHTRTVTGLVNLPNGQLASVSEDQTVAIWTRKGKIWDGSEVSRTQFDTPITCAVFTDQLLVATWNNKIHSLDLRSQAISLFVRSSSSAYIERSVPCHQGSAVFLSSEGNVAGELLTDEWEKKSVLLLRGASCAVELHQDLWIVGTKLGEIVACGGGESAVSTPLCKAHDGDIIGIVAIPDCEGKPSTLCSVSKDCSVKIWQLEQDGKIALKLIGCWMAPVEPNYVIFCETSGEIWIGDMVGSIYRLKFDAM
uniref:Uncharacterized protein n=1 Tax=Plectus sambesii TaxID=2011161 RepID=A0A914W5H3_9BILA